MIFRYTTPDERFGSKEELTLKEMMLRYRVNGYDMQDGKRMTTNEMLEDIYENGAQCVTPTSFL